MVYLSVFDSASTASTTEVYVMNFGVFVTTND